MTGLIVCFSHTGNNRALARHLSERLSANVIEVSELSKRTGISIVLDVLFGRKSRIAPIKARGLDFQYVLFLGPIWNRHVGNPLLSAVRAMQPELPEYYFATLCGAIRPGQQDSIRRELTDAAGKAPAQVWQLPLTEMSFRKTGSRKEEDVLQTIGPEHLVHFAAEIEAIVSNLPKGQRP